MKNNKDLIVRSKVLLPGRKQKDLAKLDKLGEWGTFTTLIKIDSCRIKIRINED